MAQQNRNYSNLEDNVFLVQHTIYKLNSKVADIFYHKLINFNLHCLSRVVVSTLHICVDYPAHHYHISITKAYYTTKIQSKAISLT